MTSCVRIGIAASMIGVCTRTIRRWDAAGKITCIRTPGGHRRISLIVIEGQQARDARIEDGDDAFQHPSFLGIEMMSRHVERSSQESSYH
nr:helix-turn-helix domain-containing protein [Candidatus Sigynarchaeum springense]